MKQTGELLTFNATVAPALNVYGQAAVQTGLIPGSSSALLLRGGLLEFSDAMGSVTVREVALARASKAAMPSLLDDDVLVKSTTKAIFVTSGFVMQDLTVPLSLPPLSVIVVESNFYLQFKLTAATQNMSCSALLYFERVELTEKELNSILASRLNNLLS